MQKPKYTPQDEQLLMTKLWSRELADDPEAYVMFVFPWGQPNTPLAKFKGPRKWQRIILRQMAAHIKKNKDADVKNLMMEVMRLARVSGRGIGKSALIAMIINWFLTTRIGSTVIVSANTEAQLKNTTWSELAKWTAMAINSHWWEDPLSTTLNPAKWLTELVERDLKKGTRYWGAQGKLWSEEKPDTYAGPHNMDGMMVIFDEASGIPSSIWSVAAGFFTENIPDRFWFAFSNGRRNNGYFYEICEGDKSDFWQSDNIDAREVEGTDQGVYNQIIAEHGEDSDEARIEVYGQFPKTGEDQFIPQYYVEDAMKREPCIDDEAPVVMGVDPARGGDKTIILVRKGRNHIATMEHDDKDLMVTVGHVIEAIEKYKPMKTFIDEGGLGAGLVDRINEHRMYRVTGVNFAWKSSSPKTWGNKRAEMWGNMRNWLKTGSLLPSKKMKVDLVSPKKKTDSAGTIFLESKKEMKARKLKSPDEGDALALTFAYPVFSGNEIVRKKKKSLSGYQSNNGASWMAA
jgi:hypothetical protein